MEALRHILRFYIKGSIHVALAVVALAGVTMREFNIESNASLLLFIFFGTVTAYNFIKYAAVAKFRHRSLSVNLRAIQIFSFLCFIGLVYFASRQTWPILFASGLLGLVSLFYEIPLYPQSKNLRSISGIKIFVIALSWAGVTVILPALAGHVFYTYAFLITFIQRCLFIIALTIPFDIRDLGLDEPQLGTIPQIYGAESAKTTGILLLGLVVLLEMLKAWVSIQEVIVLIVIATITYYLVRKSTQVQSKYFASFWVEGVPILWWVLLLLASSI